MHIGEKNTVVESYIHIEYIIQVLEFRFYLFRRLLSNPYSIDLFYSIFIQIDYVN